MPVSLERLIAEVEPAVITVDLTRDCIKVNAVDGDIAEEKRRTIPFKEVECLALSFKNIACIQNLGGFDKLTKLQLDNNRITAIDNISHLTNLTWLDLSFNKISKIEGLETLVQLTDLSLYANEISVLEGLDTLKQLQVLSVGRNQLAKLDCLGYLRPFTNLQLLNLAGNPLCREADYNSYVLSHLKHLVYLDYRRVSPNDVSLAIEQHQDEVLELHEKEEAAALEAAAAAERAAHGALMLEANLGGVESLLEDMMGGDPEWHKMVAIPGLVEPWHDVRDKWQVLTEEFKNVTLAAHERRKAEVAAFRAALAAALEERDVAARRLITEFEKAKKAALRRVREDPDALDDMVLNTKVKVMALQHGLLELEMDAAEVVGELVAECDRNITELAEADKLQYNTYFTQVRDLQSGFFNLTTASAPTYLERYSAAAENPEFDELPEEAQLLVGDKDALLSALQVSHDSHVAKIDALEDQLLAANMGRATQLADSNNSWAAQRHRDRMAEILSYLERNMHEVDALVADLNDLGGDAGDGGL